MSRLSVEELFRRLHAAYGPQRWWPAETRFEVLAGAVLTQNTAWRNVERAIARLRAAGCLEAGALLSLETDALEDLVRPAGTFRVKARRLRALCEWFRARGGFAGLDGVDTATLRDDLLAVHGVGRETADAILLYAFQRPVFVVDAYTGRLFSRLGVADSDTGYEALRAFVERQLPGGEGGQRYNELHALIVEHCKAVCRRRPLCGHCCLRDVCGYAATATGERAAGGLA